MSPARSPVLDLEDGLDPSALRVGGLVRLSTVDWPGQLAATVFTQGCPWDCAYCHNPHLIATTPSEAFEAAEPFPWHAVVAFLASRVGLLDGVVFSGGEPLAQPALPAAVGQVADLGLRVALHTSGVAPARFEAVLPRLDWVGFDAKAPLSHYDSITRVAGSGERARASLRLLLESGVDHEVRTTVHPDLLGESELLQLAEELRALGVISWALQPFRPEGARPGLDRAPRSLLAPALVARLAEGFSAFEVRG